MGKIIKKTFYKNLKWKNLENLIQRCTKTRGIKKKQILKLERKLKYFEKKFTELSKLEKVEKLKTFEKKIKNWKKV